LLWPTLQAIKALGGSGSLQEIEDQAIDIAELSDEQLAVLHGNGPQSEIHYRMAWARTYLKRVGALDSGGRGVWAITEYGQTLTLPDMVGIPRRVRAMSPRKLSNKAKRDSEEQDAANPPVPRGSTEASSGAITDVSADQVFSSTVDEQWRERLLGVLQAMPPASFERLCQRVLRQSGFTRVEVTGKSGDGGIDGIGVLRIALLSFQVFFQCKRYKGSVGAATIRDFRGAMVGRTDKGLLMTTGSFTPDAKREATRDGAPVLDLIDGDDLCMLLKDLSLGVSTKQVEEVTIDAHWFESL
jgi:restriction system protein